MTEEVPESLTGVALYFKMELVGLIEDIVLSLCKEADPRRMLRLFWALARKTEQQGLFRFLKATNDEEEAEMVNAIGEIIAAAPSKYKAADDIVLMFLRALYGKVDHPERVPGYEEWCRQNAPFPRPVA